MPSDAKRAFMCGSHALGAQDANAVRTVTTKDVFNIALFLASGSLGAATSAYSTTSELAASGNYTQGGKALTNANAPSVSGTTGIWTPSASVTWTALTSSGSFDCALVYNATSTGKLAIAVLTFSAQSITAGDFTLTMPTNDASNAMIRLG
jgi:hypothetical protein